ncbi:MAG: ABC-type Fe3+-hydroxamate transport system substrate-binding protein [Planctomycetota bacterium]
MGEYHVFGLGLHIRVGTSLHSARKVLDPGPILQHSGHRTALTWQLCAWALFFGGSMGNSSVQLSQRGDLGVMKNRQKQQKWISSGWGVVVLIFLVMTTSCVESAEEESAEEAASTAQISTHSPQTGFPLSILCADGYQLELDQPPKRVIPANATALDFVLSLIDVDRIVAISEISIPYAIHSEEFEQWPIEKTFGNFTVEEMVACKPDLIIVHEWQNAQTVAILREAGFAVLVINSMTKLEDCFDNLELLGRILGAERASKLKTEQLKQRIGALKKSSANAGDSVLSYTNFGTGGTSAGKGSSFDVMVGIAGLTNAATDAGVIGFDSVDIEWLLSIDPDWIVVGESVEEPGTSATGSFLRSTASLQGLRAVRENRIIQLTAARFNTSSFQLVDGAEDLLAQMKSISAN